MDVHRPWACQHRVVAALAPGVGCGMDERQGVWVRKKEERTGSQGKKEGRTGSQRKKEGRKEKLEVKEGEKEGREAKDVRKENVKPESWNE